MAIYRGDDGSNNLAGTDANDSLAGGGGDDIVRGGGGNDMLSGGQGNDGISGGQGNDRIYGGGGDDHIYGGKGDDTVQYRGNIDDYTFSVDRLGRVHLTDKVANRDGADIIDTVEHFQFANNTVYDLVNGKLVPSTAPHGHTGDVLHG